MLVFAINCHMKSRMKDVITETETFKELLSLNLAVRRVCVLGHSHVVVFTVLCICSGRGAGLLSLGGKYSVHVPHSLCFEVSNIAIKK